MADFGGFQVQTPQEVLAKLAKQQQDIQRLPPRQARNANIQFQIANMFGNPELQKARRIEDRMNAVNESSPPSTDLQSEKVRLGKMFDAVKDLDPAAAAQISQQILTIDNELVERSRLQQADERSARAIDIQERNIALQEERFGRLPDFSNFGFVIDPNDPNGKPRTLDLSDPAQAAEWENAAANGLTPLTQAQAYEQLDRAQINEAMQNQFNKSDHRMRVAGYTAQSQFLKQGNRLMKRFTRNPNTGTLVLDLTRGIRGLASEGRAAVQQMQARDGSDYSEAETKGWIRSRIDDMIKNEGLRIAEQDRSIYEAAILNMGYVLARSLDSGGRLSDQDVNMAIRMLTGGSAIFEDGTVSVPAEQIAAVMLERANDINGMLGTDSPDAVLFDGDTSEQGRQINGLRALNRELYNEFSGSAKEALGEEMFNRVMFLDGPTDQEVIDARRDQARRDTAERVSRGQAGGTILRPNFEVERSLPKGAGVVYDENGEVIQILDDPTQWQPLLRGLPEGQRLRIKDGQGNMGEPEIGQ